MSLQRLFGVFFLVCLSGCLESQVARKSGAATLASRAGLKAEWIQSPLVSEGENPALYPYAKRVMEGAPVQWRVLSLTNQSSERLTLYFGAWENDELEMRLSTYCPILADRLVPRGNEVAIDICRYISRWKVSGLEILREYHRMENSVAVARNETEPLKNTTDLRTGEKIELIATLILTSGSPIPGEVLGDPAKEHFLPRGLPSLYTQQLLSTDFRRLLRPSIYREDSTPIEVGDFAAEVSFHGPSYFDFESREKQPGRKSIFPPEREGIPLFE
ncbi:MAG: hypothetical protein H7301_12990 [Cryobacterium sp.]|nr:hypothetical protein [Oligoflexia bacterium]